MLEHVLAIALGTANASDCLYEVAKPTAAVCQRIAKLGRFERARAGPRVRGKPTQEVFYDPQWGTGVKIESVALIRRTGAAWKVIWSHPIEDSYYPLDGAPQTRTLYRWSYSSNGDRVYVSGVRRQKTSDASFTQLLARETYCYRPRRGVFERCD